MVSWRANKNNYSTDLTIIIIIVCDFKIQIIKLHKKYDIKVRKYNDFVSVAIDFVVLNILLVIIDIFTVSNGYANSHWYFTIALPILVLKTSLVRVITPKCRQSTIGIPAS